MRQRFHKLLAALGREFDGEILSRRLVYAHAREIGVAVGAPDLLPYRKGQLNHAYKLMPEVAAAVPTAIAVQEGNYSHTNPSTGARVTIAELLDFARRRLKVSYMFWFPEEPFFSGEVVGALRSGFGVASARCIRQEGRARSRGGFTVDPRLLIQTSALTLNNAVGYSAFLHIGQRV